MLHSAMWSVSGVRWGCHGSCQLPWCLPLHAGDQRNSYSLKFIYDKWLSDGFNLLIALALPRGNSFGQLCPLDAAEGLPMYHALL